MCKIATLFKCVGGDFMKTNKKRISVSLTEEKIKDFEKLVKKMGLTKSTLVAIWIQKELENFNK